MGSPSYDDINGLYTTYLGRPASQDDYANWLSGNYGSTDLSGISSQIQSSGEASDYKTRQGGGGTPPPTDGSQETGTAPPATTVPPMNTGTPPGAGTGSGSGSTSTQTPAPAPAPAPAPPKTATADDISGFYTTYLGRPAKPDEVASWLSGTYGHTDLPGIETQIKTSGEGQDYMASHLTKNPLATFTGFDPSRLDSNTLKYNAMQVLGSFNPNDPTAMTKAFGILNAKYPGQYQLDSQGNLLLTGTADGYIGARPVGWGSGGAWEEPNGSNYDWQWLAYNDAHRGPKGEGTGIGAGTGTAGKGTGTGTGTGSTSFLDSLKGLLGLGSTFGGPGSPGIFTPSGGAGSSLVQQIGQDPFSLAITGALTKLLGTAAGHLDTPAKTPIDDSLAAYLDWAKGKATTDVAPNDADAALSALLTSAQGHLTSTPQDQAAAFEKARMPYEMARKVQLGNAGDQLANRGLLSDTTPGGGLQAGALDRIETNLSPAFTAALANAWQDMNTNEQNWAGVLNNAIGTDTTRQTGHSNIQQGFGRLWGDAIATGNTRETQQGQATRDWATALTNAATAGTTRQTGLSDIAIRELATNNQFTEFLAQYGLDHDVAMYNIAHGQNTELLTAFQLWLDYAKLSNEGFV